ncbi:MAG TPA: hypothetical protein VM489_03720 [Burkholderiales bacterium]|nr:hypothetical protein [Burkholderiales bacterium]
MPERPARVAAALLAALEAAEGRRRSRKRDQTPDAIGLAAKRALLERVVREDPEPPAFEAWLLRIVVEDRAAHATARMVLEEWRQAQAIPEFAAWLAAGAPSEDAKA